MRRVFPVIAVCALLAFGCGDEPVQKASVETEQVDEKLTWADEGYLPEVFVENEAPPTELANAIAGLWKIGDLDKEDWGSAKLFGVIGSDIQLRMYMHHVIAVKPTDDGWEQVFHVYKTVDQNFNPDAVVSKSVMIIDNGPMFTHHFALEGVRSDLPEASADSEGQDWTYSAYSLNEDYMYWTCSAHLIGRPIAIDGSRMVTIRTTNVVETFEGKPAKVQLEVRNVYSCRLIAAFEGGELGGYWYASEPEQEGGISLFESYHPVRGKESSSRYDGKGEYVIEEPDGRIEIAPDYSSARIELDGEVRVLKRVE